MLWLCYFLNYRRKCKYNQSSIKNRMEKKKIFKAAPLPFMGQKRKFLKQFEPALKKYSSTATYVDLFGGSGLLSHTVKSLYPNATVIYNDFDNYRLRLENVDRTNKLLSDLRVVLANYPKDKRIIGEITRHCTRSFTGRRKKRLFRLYHSFELITF